jgi:hypothetical protein
LSPIKRSPTKSDVEDALDAFLGLFSSTLELVEELIASRSYAQEVLILICSRLDALASSSAREDEPRKKAFVDFVTSYGRRRDLFQSISVGDLYYELAYHRWMLPGTIDKPGRLRRYTRVDDPILALLIESGIPLVEQDADRLLGGIMKGLRRSFRVMPGQPRAKPFLGKTNAVTKAIVEAFDTPRKRNIGQALPKALGELLHAKTMATILYERFRSEAIHGARVLIDERRFWRESGPYWDPHTSEYFGSYILVEFPARFLVDVLRDCIGTYRAHLIAKGALPPDVLFHAFGGDSLTFLEFLDEDAIAEGRPLRFDFPRR